MLPDGKRKLLFVARSQLGLTDAQYRTILVEHGGVRSASDLDAHGFELVLDRFRQLGFVTERRQAGFGDRLGMATDGQVELIRRLWAEVSGDLPEGRLNRWLLGHFGVSALRFTTKDQAAKVIAALKAWKRRKEAGHEAAG